MNIKNTPEEMDVLGVEGVEKVVAVVDTKLQVKRKKKRRETTLGKHALNLHEVLC